MLEQSYKHIKKMWSVRTSCCTHGYHAAVGKLRACKREAKNAVGTVAVMTDDLSDTEEKVVILCHESPAGIEDEAFSCEIAC